MVIFFGQTGAGKSTQGQMLSDRNGWSWLSVGQLLRDSNNEDLRNRMQSGDLVPDDVTNKVINNALDSVPYVSKVVLDGYPRNLDQAKWLVENQRHGNSIGLVVVLDIEKNEIIKRLKLRGRIDDTPTAIKRRLAIYKSETDAILNYFKEKDVKIVYIDGSGTVGEVHGRITDELTKCKLV